MDIKEYSLKKQESKQEKDIIKVINNTLVELQMHLRKLETGEIYDTKTHFAKLNIELANMIIEQEKSIISDAIQSLKVTRKNIIKSRTIENFYHSDEKSNGM